MSGLSIVSYIRVSTERQGKSGLGLKSQQFAVREYLKASHGNLLAEFIEIETGRRRDRPQLLAALALCAQRRATLVVGKLDRLARNVAFISSLLESRVRFTALDMPEANATFLQMAAVFAEWEAKRISERTSSALQAAKARGKLLGWANPARHWSQREASSLAAIAVRKRAVLFARNTQPVIESIRSSGITSLTGLASALNSRGIRTRRGGRWHATTVKNLLRLHERCGAIAG